MPNLQLNRVTEIAAVTTRTVETAKVFIRTRVHSSEQWIQPPALERCEVDVQRLCVNEVVDTLPSTRVVGEVTIVPVFEETFVVVRQWLVKEELHIRTRRTAGTPAPQRVVLRSESIEIERVATAHASHKDSDLQATISESSRATL